MLSPEHSAKEYDEGLENDPEVEFPRELLDVLNVELDPFLEVEALAAGTLYLPETGDTGANAETCFSPRGTVLVFSSGTGSGTDDGHVTEENVDELRELVDVEVAEEFADAGQAGILLDEELRTIGLVRNGELCLDFVSIFSHGAELDAAKFTTTERFARVDEKEGTAIFEVNRQHDERIEGTSQC